MTITAKALMIGIILTPLGAGLNSPEVMVIGIAFALGAIVRIIFKRL